MPDAPGRLQDTIIEKWLPASCGPPQKKRSRTNRERFFCKQTGLGHPPGSVRLTAGDAASELGPPMDVDLLSVVRAAIPATVAIIIADFQVTICVATRAAPIIAGMRAASLEAAVIGVDLVAAVLAGQAIVAVVIAIAVIATVILRHDRLNGASCHRRRGQDGQRFFLPHGLFLSCGVVPWRLPDSSALNLSRAG